MGAPRALTATQMVMLSRRFRELVDEVVVDDAAGLARGIDALHRPMSDNEHDEAAISLRGGLQQRYVRGAGADEVIVWRQRRTNGTYARRFLLVDERGSVIFGDRLRLRLTEQPAAVRRAAAQGRRAPARSPSSRV